MSQKYNKLYASIIVAVCTVSILASSLIFNSSIANNIIKYFPILEKTKTSTPFKFNEFVNADTLYTLGTSWIEINLKSHTGTLHQKYEKNYIFRISAGTEKISEGIETPEGIFLIRSKLKKTYSKQFDSTLLINWMGFSNGVGFHALSGNGYYYNLGKRNSSHGCIRVTKDDSAIIYDRVSLGTPVIVSKEGSAISVNFVDSTDTYAYLSKSKLESEISRRLNLLYEGKYYSEQKEKLVIDTKNIGHSGISIGEVDKIPEKQIIPKK